MSMSLPLFRNHRRSRINGRTRRKRQRQPCVPTRRPVMSIELIIRFRVYVGLHRSQRNDVPDLRTNTNDARFEGAQLGSATAVGGKLLIKVADRAHKKLL